MDEAREKMRPARAPAADTATGAQTTGEGQRSPADRYEDWQSRYRSGQLEGYKQGAPPSTSAAQMTRDRAAAETPCRCGASREYRPFQAGATYRFFALCRRCGLSEELQG